MFCRPIALSLASALFLGAILPSTLASQDQSAPTATVPASPSAASQVSFTAEITRYQLFTHDIGHNLTFRMTPTTTDEGGGWVIEIIPAAEPSDGPAEFVAIATPPYHAYNDRYLAAAFGYSAKEAIQSPIRKFNFVQSVMDEQRANEVVNAALYPSTVSEAEKARVAAEAAALNLGTGQLRIAIDQDQGRIHHTVSASILSYSEWVPKKRITKTCAEYCKRAISR